MENPQFPNFQPFLWLQGAYAKTIQYCIKLIVVQQNWTRSYIPKRTVYTSSFVHIFPKHRIFAKNMATHPLVYNIGRFCRTSVGMSLWSLKPFSFITISIQSINSKAQIVWIIQRTIWSVMTDCEIRYLIRALFLNIWFKSYKTLSSACCKSLKL